MTIVNAAILILATWRIASLLSEEMGPGDIFDKLRQAVGVKYDEHGFPLPDLGWVAKQASCLWCMSLWVGVVLGVLWSILPDCAIGLALPFALSAGAIAMHSRGVRVRHTR